MLQSLLFGYNSTVSTNLNFTTPVLECTQSNPRKKKLTTIHGQKDFMSCPLNLLKFYVSNSIIIIDIWKETNEVSYTLTEHTDVHVVICTKRKRSLIMEVNSMHTLSGISGISGFYFTTGAGPSFEGPAKNMLTLTIHIVVHTIQGVCIDCYSSDGSGIHLTFTYKDLKQKLWSWCRRS